MTAFGLKLIACFSMFLDHFSYILPDKTIFLNFIGRLAFPIFAFQIAQGYIHTKNLKKYFLRLVVFAIISQLPFALFTNAVFGVMHLNVIFTLIFGLLSITAYNKISKYAGIISVMLLGSLALVLGFDYRLLWCFSCFYFLCF